ARREHLGELHDVRGVAVPRVVVDDLVGGVVGLPALEVAVPEAVVVVARVRFGRQEVDAIDAVAPVLVVPGDVTHRRLRGETAVVLPGAAGVTGDQHRGAGAHRTRRRIDLALGGEVPGVRVGDGVDRVLVAVPRASVRGPVVLLVGPPRGP